MPRARRLVEGAAAVLLGFCVPAVADLITIDLAASTDTMTFSKNAKGDINLVFDGGDGSFPGIAGKATSVKQVAGKADQKDAADYVLRYLDGLKITLTHGKDQDNDTWNVTQTGGARFVQFCYAVNTGNQCTRLPNPPALLDSHLNLTTFKQNPADKDGKAVFNFVPDNNLLFFNTLTAPRNVAGKLLEGSPQFTPPGLITLTVNLGKGFDLNTVAKNNKDKTVPLAGGQAKLFDKKAAAPDKKAEMKAPAKSGGNSVTYGASAGKLEFHDDRITDTGYTSDPVVNALVSLPDLFLAGARDDIYVFMATDDDAFDISSPSGTYVNAELPVLFYDAAQNSFFGKLGAGAFASLGSAWVDALSAILDPASPDYDRTQKLWFTYTPDENLFQLTGGFTGDGFSSGQNLLFASPQAAAPAAASLLLVAAGLLGWGALRLRARQRPQIAALN